MTDTATPESRTFSGTGDKEESVEHRFLRRIIRNELDIALSNAMILCQLKEGLCATLG